MYRRKGGSSEPAQSTSTTTNGNSTTVVPMGGGDDVNFMTPPQPRRRIKKKKLSQNNCFRTCMIRCRIMNNGRNSKTIESLSTRPRSGRGGGCRRLVDEMPCCVILSSFFCFLIITTGLYNAAYQTNNGNLILRSTTNIPSSLLDSLIEFRPDSSLSLDDEIPILLLHDNNIEKLHTRPYDYHHHQGRELTYPSELHRKEKREAEYIDFGLIDIKLLADDDQKRQIYIMVEDLQGDARSLNEERDDDYDMYWNFDDDKLRNPYLAFDDYDPETMEGRCRRTSWHRLNLPNCNTLHEMDLITNTPRFVGDGAYREVFVTELPYMDSIEQTIFKELRWDLEQAYDDFEYVRMDAFVTERFTSNKNIVDIYGYCGLSMLTEYFKYGDIEDDVVGYQHHRADFNPVEEPELQTIYNSFTPSQKLKLALSMVEPLEALHNFEDGVIVHDDVQLCQYLWTDGTKTDVKLNDFNRAEIMLWDEQDQQYCKYKNGRGHGDWRAPEEFADLPLDEKIDIWSLGNNFYSLLTGYYPFFNVEKDKEIQRRIKRGETAVIDPRYLEHSFAERKLVEIIERCYVYDPDLRADISEIKQMLVDAIAENEKWEKEQSEKRAEEVEREQIEAKKRFREKQHRLEEAKKGAEEKVRKQEAKKLVEEAREKLAQEHAHQPKKKAARPGAVAADPVA